MGTAALRNQPQFIDWEQLESSKRLTVLRFSVPGGWLVYAYNGYHKHGGLTFYPDPEHRWDGGSSLRVPE